jgi:uncharacterized protein (DUF1499 family)
MKIVLIIIAILILGVFVGLFVLGLISQSGEATGMVEAKLARCPDRPNCICSEFETDVTHYVDPVKFSITVDSEVLSRLKKIVEEMGGRIQAENDNYLAVSFTSSFFRFVDDLEIRIDADQKMIHLRSAARVGYSDRGVNKKRVEQLKSLYQKKTN